MSVHIALLEFSFHIPESNSLKEKRRVLKSLKDRVRHKFNVSIAEVGDQDKWQIAEFALTMVGNDRSHIDKTLQHLISMLESLGDAQLTNVRTSYL